jgi:raffinose/stachyose/melibiose transport system permease protein
VSTTLKPGPTQELTEKVPRRKLARRGVKGGATRVHPALLLFPLPALALYVAFFAIPTLQAVQYSITDWDGFSADFENVGAGNFERIATNDDLFMNALTNNVKFMLVVVLFQTVLALMLAVFLVKNSRGSTLLRALFFFPTILSSVSVAFIWKFIYDPNFGLGNRCSAPSGWTGFSRRTSGTTRPRSTGWPSRRCGSTPDR